MSFRGNISLPGICEGVLHAIIKVDRGERIRHLTEGMSEIQGMILAFYTNVSTFPEGDDLDWLQEELIRLTRAAGRLAF